MARYTTLLQLVMEDKVRDNKRHIGTIPLALFASLLSYEAGLLGVVCMPSEAETMHEYVNSHLVYVCIESFMV